MVTMITIGFFFEEFLLFLIWGVLLVFNLWTWQKTKAQANLVMMIGAGILAVGALLWAFSGGTTTQQTPLGPIEVSSGGPSNFVAYWLPIIGAGTFVFGFFLSSKALVEAQLKALKAKIGEVTSGGDKPSGDGDAGDAS